MTTTTMNIGWLLEIDWLILSSALSASDAMNHLFIDLCYRLSILGLSAGTFIIIEIRYHDAVPYSCDWPLWLR